MTVVDPHKSRAALRTGFALSGLDIVDLVAACAGIGDHVTTDKLDVLLTSADSRSGAEHDTVAVALNETLSDQGMDHPVPLSAELDAAGEPATTSALPTVSAVEPGPADPPVEVMHARRIADRICADRVAVALTVDGDNRAMLRGSDPVLAGVGEMVETVGEGPGTDVLRTARPITTPDLHAAADRWPVLLSTFTAPPQIRSLLLVPIAAPSATDPDADDVLGLMAFSRDQPHPFAPDDVEHATRAGELLAFMLLSRVSRNDASQDDEGLDTIIDDRAHLVPRAVGLLSAIDQVDAHEARRRLHEQAFTAGQSLHQRAANLLHGHSRPPHHC